MFAFKSCPRCCRGDLCLERSGEAVCLQCGYELKAEERARLLARLRTARQALRTPNRVAA